MAAIGLLSPLFLLGTLAVAVPVVLHLLRQRADPVQLFSAVKLLRTARVEQARRRRPRDLLLFALRVATVVLLALAFARPYLQGAAPAELPVTVIVADVSASLSGDARTARLRTLARAALDAAPSSHSVALVEFATSGDLLIAPTTDRGVVQAAIDRLAPGFGATSYRAGLARAAEVVANRGGRLVVVTDLQAAGWSEGPQSLVPPDVPVEIADVGPLPPDVSVVSLEPGGADRLRARLRSTGPRKVTVRFEIDGTARATSVVTLGSDGMGDVSAATEGAAWHIARALVADPQGLPADDQRWLVAAGSERPAVVIVASAGVAERDVLYVERALQALDGPRAVTVSVRMADRIQAEGILSGAAAVIVVGTAGLDRRGADGLARYVREGGGLLLAVGPGVTPELLAAGFGDAMPRIRLRPPGGTPLTLALADIRHQALAVFGDRPGAFANARFTRTASVLGTDTSDVLARFDSGEPALVANRVGKGRLVVFASDLANRWNDLPLQPAFVPLVAETVGWLVGATRPPDEIMAGVLPLAGTDRPGVVSLPLSSLHPAARVAVNVDPREFDPARQTAAEFLARVPRAESSSHASGQSAARRDEAARGLWRYGLALALALLVVESIVGRRA